MLDMEKKINDFEADLSLTNNYLSELSKNKFSIYHSSKYLLICLGEDLDNREI